MARKANRDNGEDELVVRLTRREAGALFTAAEDCDLSVRWRDDRKRAPMRRALHTAAVKLMAAAQGLS